MVACGGLVVSVAGAVIEVIASLVEDLNGGLPRGVTRDGGVYTGAGRRQQHRDDDAVLLWRRLRGGGRDMVEDNKPRLSYLEKRRLDVDYTTGEP